MLMVYRITEVNYLVVAFSRLEAPSFLMIFAMLSFCLRLLVLVLAYPCPSLSVLHFISMRILISPISVRPVYYPGVRHDCRKQQVILKSTFNLVILTFIHFPLHYLKNRFIC